jgi:DICT domain-containing protein
METVIDLLALIIANPDHARHYRVLAERYKKEGRVNEYSALSHLIEKRFHKNDNDTDNN